jgi:hypothetical protein
LKKTRGERRGSPVLGALVIVASFVLAIYFWIHNASEAQREKIVYLEKLTTRLQSETVPLRFMILSREGGTIAAKVKLYDLTGRELAAIEKSWPGTVLYVDMLLAPARADKSSRSAEAWLAFPYRIFTDRLPAASGSLLFDSYDAGGFPEVLRGVAWSAAEEAAIKGAFRRARRSAAAGAPAADSASGSFGSAVHELSELSKLEEKVVYKVVCRVKGGVEIMEDR